MEFFGSLSIDVKFLVVAAVGAMLLAFATTDKKKEKRYVLFMTVLVLVAILRYSHAIG